MPAQTQSNTTNLRIAEEVIGTPKTVSAPVWHPYEPDGYGDFGAEIKTTSRAPISESRQKRKGAVTDLDASASFNQDFTTSSLKELMQGFMFASWRKKPEDTPSAVSATVYTVAAGVGTSFGSGSIAFATGFAIAGNNGEKLVTAVTSTTVAATGLAIEGAPPSDAKLTKVGFIGAAGVIGVSVTAGVATITSSGIDFTTQGLIPGEWVWVGGDAVGDKLATSASNGFYRIKTISATALVCDRAPDNVATDTGTGKTVRIYMGHVIKNEALAANQVFRTYQAERKISATEYQYITGCGADELKVSVKTADKISMDVGLVGLDEEIATGAKAGTRPDLPTQSMLSAATDYTRLRLTDDATGNALAGFMTDLEFTIKNGLEPNKAIGSIGGVGFSFGDFMVEGTVEAYFSTVDAITAVRANADVSLDQALVANVTVPGESARAVGWLFDLPLVQLGDARLKVEKDKAIKLPLSMEAVAHDTLDHTLLVQNFAFLPALAA